MNETEPQAWKHGIGIVDFKTWRSTGFVERTTGFGTGKIPV